MDTNKQKEMEILPLLPLRGILVYPNMLLKVDVGRDKSIAALEKAMQGDQRIFTVAQRDAAVEEPHIEDLYGAGTVARIKQILRMPDESLRVLVSGEYRALLLDVEEQGEMQSAHFRRMISGCSANEIETAAYLGVLKSLAREFSLTRGVSSPELLQIIEGEDGLDTLCDIVAVNLLSTLKDKQAVLECRDLCQRAQTLCDILSRETQVAEAEKQVAARVRERIDRHQREYYLTEQMRVIREELGDDEEREREELKARLGQSQMNAVAREKLETELKRMGHMAPGSPEGSVSRNYVEYMLDLPWGVYTAKRLNLERARKILQADHYGLEKVKQRILEFLAVSAIKENMKGPILCLVGPPGVGKTSIAQSVARALGRKFVRLSLGGVRDEAEIRGHRRTYIGAIPGRIVAGIKQAGSMDPVFLLDEIDKMASDFRGDPASAMLEVLDPEQNNSFSDHYLEAPLDLSSVLFITTANSLEGIPHALLDRMEVIPVSSYTLEEKIEIGKRHLWPKQLAEHGLKRSQVKLGAGVMREIIEGYTREAGVRSLYRELGTLCRKAAVALLEQPAEEKTPISIKLGDLKTYLGVRRFTRDMPLGRSETGVVNGLAWTQAGGETLSVEVAVMPGTGKLDLTGQLGDVMQESARTAYSYIRSRSQALHIPEDFHQKYDLHIHVPEGATPKDGPSAGVALTCAMVSAITGRAARQDVAMTGEVTLRGRVLPIGGVKEKLLAAHRVGIDTVLLPSENEKDLDELPAEVRGEMDVKMIGRVDQALEYVLLP